MATSSTEFARLDDVEKTMAEKLLNATFLPSVTADDNGATMVVANGKWQIQQADSDDGTVIQGGNNGYSKYRIYKD